MSYQVTITRITERTVTKNGAYTVIKQQPWNAETFHQKSMYEDPKEFIQRNPVESIYGYAPQQQVVEKVETQVLSQTVEELDLKKVISAINGL